MADFGYAPYEEATAMGNYRTSLAQRLLTGLGQGLAGAGRAAASIGPYTTPLAGFGAGFAGGYGQAQAAHQAALDYATKQIAAQRQGQLDEINKANVLSQISARNTKEEPQPSPQMKLYNDLLSIRDDDGTPAYTPERARSIAFPEKTPKAADAGMGIPPVGSIGPLTPLEQKLQPLGAAGQKSYFEALGGAMGKAAGPKDATAESDLPKLDDLKGTTASGHTFVDVSQLSPKQKAPVVAQSYAQGLVPVDKSGVQALGVIDKARNTLNSQLASVEPYLATTAGGRVANYPNIKLGQIFQTNPDLGAYSAWRDGAIQALQGLSAGGTGLRIQQSAINNMIASLPRTTDTWATAQRKVQIIQGMIDNAERPIVTRNWQKTGGASAAAAPIQWIRGPNGRPMRAPAR